MSLIVHTYSEGKSASGLAAGLRWSVLSGAAGQLKPSEEAKAIRRQAGLIGAQNYVTYEYDGAKLLGQYTEPPRLSNSQKPPKALYSLALVFLASLRQSGLDTRVINAILLVEPHGFPGKRALVIIEGGQIVRDVVDNFPEAIASAIAAREILSDHQVYSQYADISGANDVDWEFLYRGCNKVDLLRPVPRSPALLLGITAVALAVVGWFSYQHFIVKPEKERQRRIAVQKADKTPEYVSLLRTSLAAVGWEDAHLQQELKTLTVKDAKPFYHAGWALERRDCSAVEQRCITQWKRTGGQLPDLLALLPEASYDVAGSNLDTAKMSEPLNIVRASREPENLPALEPASKKLREVLQRLSNADVAVASAGSERWPAMPYGGVRPDVIAVRAPVEISASLPVIAAALRELPPSVVMDSYSLIVSSGDIGTLFKVTVKGYIYAK